jgi:cytochrome c peroxidase
MDGLRWDLLNDGIGNHKKTRSLVYAHKVAPAMAMGVRQSAEHGVRAGFKFILFAVVPEETAVSVDEYLKTIEPDSNPNRDANGKLSEAATRGKAVFEGKALCVNCHSGPFLTDMRAYGVGTAGPYEPKDMKLYTTRLNELYRNAPYLHDGRTADLKEVITIYNKEDKHGKTTDLTPQEIDDLVAYLKSL